MPDEFDLSQEQQAEMLTYHIAEQIRIYPPKPIINCSDNCGPNIPHGKECTYYKDCLEDWQLRNK